MAAILLDLLLCANADLVIFILFIRRLLALVVLPLNLPPVHTLAVSVASTVLVVASLQAVPIIVAAAHLIFISRQCHLDLHKVLDQLWLQLLHCPLLSMLRCWKTFFFEHFFVHKIELGIMGAVNDLFVRLTSPDHWEQFLDDVLFGLFDYSLALAELLL